MGEYGGPAVGLVSRNMARNGGARGPPLENTFKCSFTIPYDKQLIYRELTKATGPLGLEHSLVTIKVTKSGSDNSEPEKVSCLQSRAIRAPRRRRKRRLRAPMSPIPQHLPGSPEATYMD